MAEAVRVEPAPLPREQIGPFLLLGLDKHADSETIEAHWAERLKLARRQQVSVALEDINWAREQLRDPERRLQADVASLNADLEIGLLAQLAVRYGPAGALAEARWRPIDLEPDLSQYEPAVDLPDAEAVRASVQIPEIPEE